MARKPLEERVRIALSVGKSVAVTGHWPRPSRLLGRGTFATVGLVEGLAVRVEAASTRKWDADTPSSTSDMLDDIYEGKPGLKSQHLPKVYAAWNGEVAGYHAHVAVMPVYRRTPRGTGRRVYNVWKTARWNRNSENTTKKPYPAGVPHLRGVLRALRQLDAAGYDPVDIHGGNIMQTPSGRLILTDVVL